jgi:hypothetical protein
MVPAGCPQASVTDRHANVARAAVLLDAQGYQFAVKHSGPADAFTESALLKWRRYRKECLELMGEEIEDTAKHFVDWLVKASGLLEVT